MRLARPRPPRGAALRHRRRWRPHVPKHQLPGVDRRLAADDHGRLLPLLLREGHVEGGVVEEDDVHRGEADEPLGRERAAGPHARLLQHLPAAPRVREPRRRPHKRLAHDGLGAAQHLRAAVGVDHDVHARLRDDAVRHGLDHSAHAAGLRHPRGEVRVGAPVAHDDLPWHVPLEDCAHLRGAGAHDARLLVVRPEGRVGLAHLAVVVLQGQQRGASASAVQGFHGAHQRVAHRGELGQVDVGVAARVALVVYLEEPGLYLGVLHHEAGKGGEELVLVVDVHRPRPDGKLRQLTELLRIRLGAEERHVLRPRAQERELQLGADLELAVRHHLGDDVGLPPLDELPDALQRLRGAEQALRQGEAVMEPHVLGNHHLEAAGRVADAPELHHLRVVVQDVLVKELRGDEDDVPLGVQQAEDAGYLHALQRLEALAAAAPIVVDRQGADVHLHAPHLLRLEPVLPQVVHEPGVHLPLLLPNLVQLHLGDHPGQTHRPVGLDFPRRPVQPAELGDAPPRENGAPGRGDERHGPAAPLLLRVGWPGLVRHHHAGEEGAVVRRRVQHLAAEGPVALGHVGALRRRVAAGLRRRGQRQGHGRRPKRLQRRQLPRRARPGLVLRRGSAAPGLPGGRAGGEPRVGPVHGGQVFAGRHLATLVSVGLVAEADRPGGQDGHAALQRRGEVRVRRDEAARLEALEAALEVGLVQGRGVGQRVQPIQLGQQLPGPRVPPAGRPRGAARRRLRSEHAPGPVRHASLRNSGHHRRRRRHGRVRPCRRRRRIAALIPPLHRRQRRRDRVAAAGAALVVAGGGAGQELVSPLLRAAIQALGPCQELASLLPQGRLGAVDGALQEVGLARVRTLAVLLYRSPDLLQVAVEADDDLPDSLHRQVARGPPNGSIPRP
mmetsp:Transcript_15425/g.46269  ORF Transcript_15425/g.46269 Transcript_15425/m.46269 type:complete len:896 (-) Transcript_15425:20-2707(-)